MKTRAFAICFLAVSIGQGAAEELYDFDCCPNDDCKVQDASAVLLQAEGYYLPELDVLIRFGDPRLHVSRDGRYHICTRTLATPDLSQTVIDNIGGERVLKCLYVPANS